MLRDWKPDNVTLTRTAPRVWRVTGVFDLDEALFGDPRLDLPRPVGELLRWGSKVPRKFLRLYLGAKSPSSSSGPRGLVYGRVDRLYLWSFWAQFGRGAPPPARDFWAFAEPLTATLLDVLGDGSATDTLIRRFISRYCPR